MLLPALRRSLRCVCSYKGPPPFLGQAVLVFQSDDDDHMAAFERAQKWKSELEQGSKDALLKGASLQFVTKEMLNEWERDAEKCGPKTHWTKARARRLSDPLTLFARAGTSPPTLQPQWAAAAAGTTVTRHLAQFLDRRCPRQRCPGYALSTRVAPRATAEVLCQVRARWPNAIQVVCGRCGAAGCTAHGG